MGELSKMNFEEVMFADLHIHSRFSRACSKDLNIPNLVKWGRVKGIDLIGTGDFTHPIWIEEVKRDLKDNGKGIYYYEDEKGKFYFLITGEISLIYSQNGKGRKVHLVLLLPSIEIAEKINAYIDSRGLRRDYDGRPIFGIPCEEFVKDMMRISKSIEIIPAHIWTPYFGVFGSMSGFDSLEEAFGSQVENIHAIETGISSNPLMNWKLKDLNNKSIVSFSDSHSYWPHRLGREATIFYKTDSYFEIIEQIRKNTFFGTIETDPAYGKYHWDGHANCEVSLSPEKTKKLNGLCPKCGKKLTIGVEYRINELGDEKNEPLVKKKFWSVLPLHEIIALYLGVASVDGKKVWDYYWKLIHEFHNEFNILLEVSRDRMEKVVDKKLVDLIIRNREGKIKVKPGYDGIYGQALLDIDEESDKQEKLF